MNVVGRRLLCSQPAKPKKPSSSGMTAMDITACVVLSVGSAVFLINEVKDMPLPKPKKKKAPPVVEE